MGLNYCDEMLIYIFCERSAFFMYSYFDNEILILS